MKTKSKLIKVMISLGLLLAISALSTIVMLIVGHEMNFFDEPTIAGRKNFMITFYASISISMMAWDFARTKIVKKEKYYFLDLFLVIVSLLILIAIIHFTEIKDIIYLKTLSNH